MSCHQANSSPEGTSFLSCTVRYDRRSRWIPSAGDDLSGASSVNIMALSYNGPFTQA
jgi:hypothetical protein